MTDDKISKKELKRIEIQKRKFQLEQDRVTRPGECNKFITAVIDAKIVNKTVGSKILSSLKEIEIKAKVSNSTISNTITWKRLINKRIITDSGEVIEFDKIEQNEPHLLIILSAEEFVKVSKENQLLSIVQTAQSDFSLNLKSTTLIIYGLKDFCRKKKNVIGIKETEIKLTQLMLLANCSHRLHETPDDIALAVTQMSKAIAEEPFKSKQNKKLDQEQLYLTSEVKVNANENSDSLARLWHAQLTTFPKVTYEVAQSITKEYPLPKVLIEAYKSSTSPATMLANIPIIKTGPLAKNRRIGPELSRKIYTLVRSQNPEDII
ncbi:CLUMA_CG006816, isoform A [Clunio marinus]|uniref:CLUMA_CG006816, isoform A n=1 Tax=Clunio marinus TaxID=568069 RepID=A0A1J1I4G6_9DIPT|nr:CLUMA_CG006816, isoform A [Clunio marinus]